MLQKGSYLADRYEIVEKIGQGGMSDVYRAVDQVLGRDVAVKVLKEEFAEDKNFVDKFRKEATSAASLEHQNIVNIYDVGSEDGLYYIIMEYVDGITLKTYIEKKGHLNYKEVISIAIQVGRGIKCAHDNNIIHRDIKPQNIMITRDGKVKVTDFGIARAASGNTVSADVMGSVHYISPEQARGGYVDKRTDIYSLGIVMYEMATGKVPYDGDNAVNIALLHIQGEMTPPSDLVSDVPVALERIIQKATMKSPDRRYPDMGELLADLKKALVTPDEDFVVIPDPNEQDKTKVMTDEDLDKIRNNKDLDEENEDDDEDDDKLNPKMEKAVTIMGIAAAAIIALVVVYLLGSIFGWFKFTKKSEPATKTESSETKTKKVKVPSILGKTEDEAKKILEDAGFKYKNAGTRASDDYEEGKACAQSPKADSKASKGSTIKVSYSSGKSSKTVTVPSVVGMTEKDARKALEESFEVTVSYKESDSEQGVVISQTPRGNTDSKEGTTVQLVVSQGKKQIQVVNVIGMSSGDATSTLQNAGLGVTTVEAYSDSVSSGVVMDQSPKSGYVDKGTTVQITISKGQDPAKQQTAPTNNSGQTTTEPNTPSGTDQTNPAVPPQTDPTQTEQGSAGSNDSAVPNP